MQNRQAQSDTVRTTQGTLEAGQKEEGPRHAIIEYIQQASKNSHYNKQTRLSPSSVSKRKKIFKNSKQTYHRTNVGQTK